MLLLINNFTKNVLTHAVDEGRAHLFKGKNPRDIKLAGKKNSLKDCQHILGNGQKSNNKQSSFKF